MMGFNVSSAALLGSIRGIPAAAERLDQRDGGKKPVLPDRERRLFVG